MARPTFAFEWAAGKLLAQLPPADADLEVFRNQEWLAQNGSIEVMVNFADLIRSYAEKFNGDVGRAIKSMERGA